MKKTLIAAGSSLIFLLGACSKDPAKSDYRKQAESFINKDGGDVQKQLGQKVNDAKCIEPTSTDVGTKFVCTGTGADNTSYTFEVTIDKKNSFLVTMAPADGAGDTPTTQVGVTDTTPGAGATETTAA